MRHESQLTRKNYMNLSKISHINQLLMYGESIAISFDTTTAEAADYA